MQAPPNETAIRSPLRFWRVILQVVILLTLAALALNYGLRLRRSAWDFTAGAHFKGDVNNAIYWGRQAQTAGIFHVYDADAEGKLEDPKRKIDYPPLRLVMANSWWRWVHRYYPDATEWRDEYDFTAPMLRANTTAELASCVLIFLLIRHWRARKSTSENLMSGLWPAAFGALLFWFNPAIIWDGHCWPQWDVWLIPFFLAAVMLASLGWWGAAGVALALGASLKGQLLLAAPVLLVWPLVGGHVGDALKLVAGFFTATMLIALPWMNPSPAAWVWLIVSLISLACLVPFVWQWQLRDGVVLGLSIAAVLIALPWHTSGAGFFPHLLPLGLIGLFAATRWLPVRFRFPISALLISTFILLLMPLYDASFQWYRLGFEYGTEKFGFMLTGNGAFNIARLVQVYGGRSLHPNDQVTIPGLGIALRYTVLTRIVSFVFVALCGIGAAIHDRRHDRRFLASMAAPWLLFFMILTQMHGRYSVWAAGMSALLAGVDFGLALLGILVSCISVAGIIENQLIFSREWSPRTLEIVRDCDPGLAWAMLVATLVYFYFAIVPALLRRRRPAKPPTRPEQMQLPETQTPTPSPSPASQIPATPGAAH